VRELSGTCTIVVDNGPEHDGTFDITTELITVQAGPDATEPDPAWEYVDDQGHYHAYAHLTREKYSPAALLPTLRPRTEHVPCPGGCGDPACEGTDVTLYFCSICDERIEPGVRPDTDPHQIPGAESWSAEYETEGRPSRRTVSVWLGTPGGVIRFGTALLEVEETVCTADEPMRSTVRLYGRGPLGTRHDGGPGTPHPSRRAREQQTPA
jgi:hypothetical protein